MWHVYIDESGNTVRRLDDPDQPIHWLAAVLATHGCVVAHASIDKRKLRDS